MQTVLALDVYGTLINPLGIAKQLAEDVGDKAPEIAEIWRVKQLEYSFRRGLMGRYKPFPDVTREALDYALLVCDILLSEEKKLKLMAQYRALEAFDDVRPALSVLETKGVSFNAFSNGIADDIKALLHHAGIEGLISSVVSVHDLETFKPDPRVYHHFNKVTGSQAEQTWLVSSNPFDIIGAASIGWKTAWVQRNPAIVFDPWEFQPTKVISSLRDLADVCLET